MKVKNILVTTLLLISFRSYGQGQISGPTGGTMSGNLARYFASNFGYYDGNQSWIDCRSYQQLATCSFNQSGTRPFVLGTLTPVFTNSFSVGLYNLFIGTPHGEALAKQLGLSYTRGANQQGQPSLQIIDEQTSEGFVCDNGYDHEPQPFACYSALFNVRPAAE